MYHLLCVSECIWHLHKLIHWSLKQPHEVGTIIYLQLRKRALEHMNGVTGAKLSPPCVGTHRFQTQLCSVL